MNHCTQAKHKQSRVKGLRNLASWVKLAVLNIVVRLALDRGFVFTVHMYTAYSVNIELTRHDKPYCMCKFEREQDLKNMSDNYCYEQFSIS